MPQDHPAFQEPEDRGVLIWRYIGLTKFLSLLENSAPCFARADQLGDPFEGSFPKTNRDRRPDTSIRRTADAVLGKPGIHRPVASPMDPGELSAHQRF